MRSSVAAVAPFLAVAAMAQEMHTTKLTNLAPQTVLVGFTGTDGKPTTKTSAYTYDYSNPATAYLTQTNSDGIVTGMPSNSVDTAIPTQPKAETSQPPVATIPAGLGTGAHTLTINASSGLTSFTISVGSSTTAVVGSPSGITGVTTSGGAKPTGSNGNGGSNGDSSNGGSDGNSAAPSSTGGNAAGHYQAPAAAGVLGALFALLI
ncbi:hypothetical protein PG993_002923 [Apiospora rasikravindrae]|uniref:Uncharacterized protein n=1 Tax=Apiospora rasikravindrae TaxID=990691 RepID=A0ABR1TY02_9PEZI